MRLSSLITSLSIGKKHRKQRAGITRPTIQPVQTVRPVRAAHHSKAADPADTADTALPSDAPHPANTANIANSANTVHTAKPIRLNPVSPSGLGLALEGGGAKGAYHMGVVKAFLEEGYRFGGVAGTSIGALNGAAIAQGDFEKAYRLWETVEPSMLFDIDSIQYRKLVNMEIDKESFRQLAAQAKKIIDNKGIDTTKIRRIVGSLIDENKLRKSRTDFGLVTVSLSDLKPVEIYKEDIPEGMVLDYLLASANLPIFGLRKINGKYFIDGGFYDNCPINLIAGKGYRDIVAVRTLAFGIVQDIRYPGINLTSITPSEVPGKVLDFRNSELTRGMKMGYYDAIRSIKGMKGKKYCIRGIDEQESMELFMKWDSIKIAGLASILDRNAPIQDLSRRYLFEKIIPEIAGMLGIKDTWTGYDDVLIALLEQLAEETGLDKYRIYTFRQFTQEIKKLPPKPALNKTDGSSIQKLLSHSSRKSVLIDAARYIIGMTQVR